MRRSWPDLPGVAVWPWPAGRELSVRIEPAPDQRDDPARAQAVDAEWRRRCAANPRLFDGQILSIVRIEPGEPIRARRDSYKSLTVQPEIETGVEQLSVTGVVLSRDESGAEQVFLGRRSGQTRVYAGMWELGPSGGIDPPPANRPDLSEQYLIEQLRREFAEETGCASPLSDIRAAAVCQDFTARSHDIVFTCRAENLRPSPESHPDRWEYDRAQWVPVRDIAQFDARNSAEIIPPTRALFRFLGWV